MIPHAALLATVIPGIVGIIIYAIRSRLRARKKVGETEWAEAGEEGAGYWAGIIATIAASVSILMIVSMGRDA